MDWWGGCGMPSSVPLRAAIDMLSAAETHKALSKSRLQPVPGRTAAGRRVTKPDREPDLYSLFRTQWTHDDALLASASSAYKRMACYLTQAGVQQTRRVRAYRWQHQTCTSHELRPR